MAQETIIIGIAGGTGSGKTTFAKKILAALGHKGVLISHDNYYRDQSIKPLEVRLQTNYDHPDSLETELLVKQLLQLQAGAQIEVPVYDFTTHTRSFDTIPIESADCIIVEGILVLQSQELRKLFNWCFYVDADADVRALRRVQRDIEERGRSIDSVVSQYLATVKPMHEQYVEPSKKYADMIINGERETEKALALLLPWIKSHINKRYSSGKTKG